MQKPLLSPGFGHTRTWRGWAGGLLALALPLLAAPATRAQSIANYTFAASTGTFTALSGGTVATASSTDDGTTAVLPIGFNFVYNGVVYTTFSASTNGFIGLGGQVSANATNNLSTGTGVRPFIAPLWDDLQLTTTSDISYATTGTAGSRVLTVEWLNEKWNYQATAAVVSFQAKLYEADGHIEFVYRPEAAAYNPGNLGASVGISAVATGSGNFLSVDDLTATPTASSTTETTTIATKPATGQVYTFTPAGTAVAAPSALTFSAISTTGGTVTFTDNSTSEFNFAVTITPTAGGTPTTTLVPSTTTAGTGTTYSTSFTGLLANTGYTVQVVALGQGRSSTAGTGTFTTQAGATLSGTYYVGTGTSPQPTRTYATLTAAAAAYTTGTLTGAVTFLLLDNAYGSAETFPITFGANASASATNTLTIRPNTGVSATITAPATVTAPSTGGGVLLLSGADYVIVDGSNTVGGTTRNLTLVTTSTTAASPVQLVSLGAGAGATNDVIRNLNLATTSSTAGIAIAAGGATAGSTGADNDNLTIQNNSITPAFVGIYVGGSAAANPGATDGLVITGNTIGSATSGTGNIGSVGAFVANAIAPSLTLNTVQNVQGATTLYGFNFSTGVTNATVSQNTVQSVVSSTNNAFGMLLGTGFTGGTVTRNKLLNISSSGTGGYGGKGIDVTTGSATSNLLIANNFIQVTAASGWTTLTSDVNAGIRLGTGGTLGGVSVYYNSINLTGTYARAGADLSAALYVGSASTALDIRNNVLSNSIVNSSTATAKSYAFYSAAATTAFTELNYNDYFVSGTQGVLGYLGADAATLAALQTATGKDANSVSVEPLFVSATDLHANSAALNNVGTPITSVTVDIDGDPRSATTPDIGADEFAPVTTDIAAVGLVAPATAATGGTCFGSAEAVTVSVRNAGASALNFATTPATITVVVTGPTGVATQTLTYTLNTGTLASGATLSVPLTGAGTTVNLSTLGTYSFAITASVAGDGNTANNTLTTSPTITVSAPVAGTLTASNTSLCVSGTTALTLAGALNGAIQLQSGTSATGPFTNISGATSATYTTATLTGTTYYRAQVTCGTTTVTSNVVTVTVNNPLVATTNTPVAICAGSTATLTATASAGASVRFFSAATGGTALTTTTAGTYTTPALTANTTYYAEAYAGTQENVGATAYNSTGQTPQTGGALYFTTTGSTTISTVTVYLNAGQAAGTVTIALRTGNSTTGAIVNNQSTAFPVPAGPTTGVAPYVVPLNYTVPAAGQYTLHLSAATQGGLVRDNAGANTTGFPFTSPSGLVSITAPSVAGFYYYFYNWQIGSECVGASRTAIQVNVTPAPATPTVTVTYPTRSTALLTSSVAPAGTTYQWYLGTTAITGATSQTYTANGTAAPGAYTVRFIATAGGCQSAPSTTVNVTATAQPLAGSSLHLFPNPTADGKLTLQLSGYTKAVTLTVIDALGRVVLTKQVTAGQSEAKLDLSGAASGVYTLRAITEGGTDVRRIVRE
jgi:hypothetical protein